jgi:hypothetical protein
MRSTLSEAAACWRGSIATSRMQHVVCFADVGTLLGPPDAGIVMGRGWGAFVHSPREILTPDRAEAVLASSSILLA